MSLQTMYEGVVNSPATTITNDINSTDTTIYLLDPTNVPAELPNLMVLGTGANAETVKVLSIDGSSIEVERGFQGTARSWNSGTVIARNFTEYDYASMIANISTINQDQVNHEEASMPHLIQDVDNNKTYKFGLRFENGKTKFIYEEVI